MKKCRKILLILAAAVFAFALFALTACGDDDGNEDAVKVTLDKTSVTLKVGETATINATVTGSEETVGWTTSAPDASTITVTTDGNACTITALKEGTAKVKADVGEASAECTVKITPADSGHEDEVSISLSKTKLTLKPDATATLTATVKNTEEAVVWAVDPDDDTIISVIPDGNSCEITAVAEGKATITATVDGKTAECTVTVSTEDVGGDESVTLDKTSLTLKVGDTEDLTATVENSEEAVEWTVSDNTVITIAKDGNTCTVTAVKAGTATITATIGEEVYAQCAVTVTENSQGGGDEDSVDVSDKAVFGHVFEAGKHAIEFYYNLMGEDYSELVQQIDPTKTTVTVKMDGNASESSILRAYWQAEGVYNLYLQITVESDWWHGYMFAVSFKNADGEEVAHATYTRAGDTELILSDETKSISTAATEPTIISIVRVNGNTDLSGLTIAWTIADTEGEGVATIEDKEDGTVSVTAVAVGKATLTCTIGTGANALIATCEITVIAGQVEPEKPLDVTNLLHEQETYPVNNINIRLDCDADLCGKIDSVEVTATMDGEPTNVTIHEVYGTGGPKYIKMGVPQDWTHLYVFTINYKNAAGKVIATGTFTKAPAKSLKLDVSTLNLELGVTGTGTITATVTGNVEGDIEWEIDDESIATILDNGDGTVTVTAVKAGTATITATVGDLTQTCTVNVLEEGEEPPVDPAVEITQDKVHDPQDVYVEGNNFVIHFYFQFDNDLAEKISLDKIELSVTKDGEEISGITLHQNSEVAAGNNCHVRAVVPGSKESGTYVVTFRFKDDAGNVTVYGSFTKNV